MRAIALVVAAVVLAGLGQTAVADDTGKVDEDGYGASAGQLAGS